MFVLISNSMFSMSKEMKFVLEEMISARPLG